jgi:DNA-binding NtrC family response regulator
MPKRPMSKFTLPRAFSSSSQPLQIKVRLRRGSDPDIFAGSSGVMAEIDRLIRQIATTDVTVLIEGESGTGKEIVARAIHERSRRSTRPFIA